jgi:hypothetical protein
VSAFNPFDPRILCNQSTKISQRVNCVCLARCYLHTSVKELTLAAFEVLCWRQRSRTASLIRRCSWISYSRNDVCKHLPHDGCCGSFFFQTQIVQFLVYFHFLQHTIDGFISVMAFALQNTELFHCCGANCAVISRGGISVALHILTNV